MKRYLPWFFIGVVALGILIQAAYMLYPQPRVGWDFVLRTNEARCVLERVDPFDVWKENVKHPYYCSMGLSAVPENGKLNKVNAYPPWAYAYIVPFAVLPMNVAWTIFYAGNIAFLFGLFFIGFRWCKDEVDDPSTALFAAAIPMLFLLPSIGSSFQSGNYSIVVLAAMLGMVWSLNRKHDVLAGLCWALAMIKPQIGILFAVPLLMKRKWLTCFIAASTCILSSVPASLLCEKNLVTLISEAVRGSAFAFKGCGTFPYFLCSLTGLNVGANVALVLGVLVTVFLTRRSMQQNDWLWIIAPAAAISSLWTYAQLYSSVMMWPTFLMLSILLVRNGCSAKMLCLVFAVGLFSSRFYTFVHGFTMLFPDRLGYSFEIHHHLDSLNSLVSLALTILVVRRFNGKSSAVTA